MHTPGSTRLVGLVLMFCVVAVLSRSSGVLIGQETSWEKGLAETVAWYKANSGRFGDVEHCLVAHPRAGLGQEQDDP